MNVFFGAQSGFIDIFQQVEEVLRSENLIEKSAYLISDSEYYLIHKEKLPLINNNTVEYMFEWEYTSKNNSLINSSKIEEIKKKYQSYNLWNAIVCDRRLMYGKHAKFRQGYKGKFSDTELYGIIYSTLYAIEQIICKVKPDVILTLTPSTFGDYLLYYAALQNKIRYLQLKFTKIHNNILLSENFGANTKELVSLYDLYKSKDSYEYQNEAKEFLKNARNAPIQYEGALTSEKLTTLRKVKSTARSFVGVLNKAFFSKRTIASRDNHVPPIYSIFLYMHLMHGIHVRAALTLMKKRMLSCKNAKTSNYVFFPLHSEPEIALLVNGINYQNQIELIRKIAQSLPFGWKLIVKEHPKSVGYRSKGYYLKILEIPNVYFAEIETKPYYWIKNSKLVATISGFVGFEAAMLGVPVITFGDVMFDMIPKKMVRKVEGLADLHEQIGITLNNYEYDESAMLRYIAASMKLSVPVNIYSVLLGKEGRVTVGDNDGRNKEIRKLAGYLKEKLLVK